MALTGGVAPHNGWIEIAGQRYQVIRGLVEYNTLNMVNSLSASVPLSGPGYFDSLSAIAGGGTATVTAIVLAQGGEATLMTCYVKCITFHLTQTVILVQGQDQGSDLNEHRTTDTWTNKMGHQIGGELCQRIGLPFSALPSKVMAGKKVGQDFVKLTDNITYLTCLHRLAEMDGHRVYMDENGTVQYRPPGTGGSYSVYWRRPTPQNFMVSDCIDLKVMHNIEASSSQVVTVSSHDPAAKQNNTATATVQGPGTPKNYYHDTIPGLQKDQVRQAAIAAADRQADHEWNLSATVVGDPDIKTDMNITLSGTGSTLDQTYPIDSILHKFGYDGYTTTVNAKGKGGRAGAS